MSAGLPRDGAVARNVGRLAPWTAAALVLLATSRRGPALSPDSAIYLSVADNLAHGRGFTQFDGAPCTLWAPLYPLLLSLGPRMGASAEAVARGLQPFLLAASVALCWVWLRRHVRGSGWRAAAIALIALSTIQIESAAFVWSESLDLVLTLACLVALDAWLHPSPTSGRSRTFAVLATASAALACLDRYASLVLVPVGALSLLAAGGQDWPVRLRRGAGFALGAALPAAAWMVRNLLLGEGPAGARVRSGFTPVDLLIQSGNALSHWVSPESAARVVRYGALGVAGAAAFTLVAAALRRAPAPRIEGRTPALLLVGFAVAHLATILVGSSVSGLERIDERLLSPIFAPLVLVLAWAADRVTGSAGARGDSVAEPDLRRSPHRVVRRTVAVLAGLWVVFTALRTADRERGYLGAGAWGLRNAAWERSELLAAVRTHPPRGLLYSNGPDALYALAGVKARLSPRYHPYNSPGAAVEDLRRFPAEVDAAGGATLVWFTRLDRPFLAAPSALSTLRTLVPDLVAGDGTTYVVVKGAPAAGR